MRPALEVADIFRHHGTAYRAEQADHLSNTQRRVMAAIETCRTAALGGHVEQCQDCGKSRIAYNSCLMGKFSNGESVGSSPQFDVVRGWFCSPLPRYLAAG
jgi:hypothetical protein